MGIDLIILTVLDIAVGLALKNRLRFEPYTNYPDLKHFAEHLDIFAKAAGTPSLAKTVSSFKVAREFLGIPISVPSPRKELKCFKKPLGNLPLEMLSCMTAYIHEAMMNGTLLPACHRADARAE